MLDAPGQFVNSILKYPAPRGLLFPSPLSLRHARAGRAFSAAAANLVPKLLSRCGEREVRFRFPTRPLAVTMLPAP
jgi:hypothetical protein